MQKYRALIIGLIMLLSSIGLLGVPVGAAGPNYMGFVSVDVAVGSTANVVAWVDVHSAIDTASIDNLTFLPAGVVNYATTTQGNLFSGQIVWMTPEGGGVINNAVGYANPITWAYTGTVNSVNRTLATMHFATASCGVATLTITAGGTALGGGDPGTTKYTGTVTVHPQTITTLTATQNGPDIDLAWTKPTGVDTVVIRYRTDTYPTSVSDGSLAYSGALIAYTHTGLTQGMPYFYSIWGVNTASGLYSMSYDTATENSNMQPELGTPSPTNGSIGQPTSLTWSIPITDIDLDLIDFRIDCSNGQFTDVAGATGGTKSLSISGLMPLTLYTMWVNATDPAGSGLTTSEWYTFETSANLPPVFGTPSPINGAINQNLALTWSITITDPESDNIDAWSIECSNGQSNSGSGASPRSASLSISGLSYSTVYQVWVNATDTGSGGTTRASYTFTTKANTPPTIDLPSPSNGQTNWNPHNGRLNCHVVDADSHVTTVSFYWGNGTLIGTDPTVVSGGVAKIDVTLAELTTYYWYAIANDGHGGTGRGPAVGNWTFTTKKAPSGGGTGTGFDVTVLVLQMNSSNPLPGATITISAQGAGTQTVGEPIATATADENGYYDFNLQDGNYILTCALPGYETQNVPITVHGDTQLVVYMVAIAPEITNYIIFLIVGLLLLGLLLAYLTYRGKIEKMTGFLLFFGVDVSVVIIGLILNNIWYTAVAIAALIFEFLYIRGTFTKKK